MSDWSSDVCSSDLDRAALAAYLAEARDTFRTGAMPSARPADDVRSLPLEVGRERPWQQLVHDDLADMLMDLLTLWSEICRIDRALEGRDVLDRELRSGEHTYELQSLMRNSYHVICL